MTRERLGDSPVKIRMPSLLRKAERRLISCWFCSGLEWLKLKWSALETGER